MIGSLLITPALVSDGAARAAERRSSCPPSLRGVEPAVKLSCQRSILYNQPNTNPTDLRIFKSTCCAFFCSDYTAMKNKFHL